MTQACADSLIVLDFETTGLFPDMGDRAIEIGAVRLEKGEVVERFQALMNPGKRVSAFIECYTQVTSKCRVQREFKSSNTRHLYYGIVFLCLIQITP